MKDFKPEYVTLQQALKIIITIERELIAENADKKEISVFSIAKEAIKKQIPVQRVDGFYGIETECPNCHILMPTEYCENCGQHLKDSEGLFLPENVLNYLMNEATVCELEDFLGYPVTADVIESKEAAIKEVITQMSEDELRIFADIFLFK